MPRRVLLLGALLLVCSAMVCPAQASKRFSIPAGYDGTSSASVLKAADEALARQDHLAAQAFYKRLLSLLELDSPAPERLRQIQDDAAKELAALSPAERTEYEEFSARVLTPEFLARVPEMRAALRTLLQAKDEEAAGGYAEGIARILPSDAEAAAALRKRTEASLRNARKAYEAGEILTAAMLLSRAGDASPAAKTLGARIQKALEAHTRLQGAMNTGDEAQVAAAAKKLAAVCAKDPLTAAVGKWKSRPAGMMLIPDGTFMMGCTPGDDLCDVVEIPAHRVKVKAFYLDQTEVTLDAYARCVEAGKCAAPKSNMDAAYCNWGNPVRGKHPVNCVDWAQARAYCGWMGKRLPTEAEWEYAARGGHDDWRYPWGGEKADCDRAILSQGGDGCGKSSTLFVGSRAPNGFGLYDMAGNVAEWLEDCVHYDYFGAPSDARPWSEADCKVRTLRGGSWYFQAPADFRVSNRSGSDPAVRDHSDGFRCAGD